MTGIKVITVLLLCFIVALLVPPVSAEPCSFCEFINISKGDTGAAGANGLAANITINATFTGAGGTAASVTNIGTTTIAIFDFLIPMGLQGVNGTPGAPGAPGANGADGAPGAANMTAGPAGPAGAANMTAGPAGAAATIAVNATFTGAVGTNADVVNVGSASAASLDFTIPQGMMNLTANMTAGPAGTPGIMNQTANMTAGPAGANGLDGMMNQTANMTAGPTGPMGPMNQTANMTAGPAGANGLDGMMNQTANMTAGPTGPMGPMNQTANMTAGPTGPMGPMNQTANMTAGPAGTPGIMNQTANMTAGIAATITINATFTGAPGTNATVNNTGTSAAAVFDFTIPQGIMNQTANLTAGVPGAPGGTGGVILFFNHSASDIATYEGLVKVPAGNAEADETATVKNALGFVLVDSYATVVGEPGLAQLPAGLWQFNSWDYVDTASGTTVIDFKIYNRTAGGTETFLFNVTSSDIDALVATLYTTTYAQATPYTISLTDRIVIKVYGRSTHSADVTFHWVYDGSTHTSNVQTPLAVADPTTLTFGAQAAETLKKGQAVYISGAVGENPTISRANNTVSSQCRVVGLVTTDLASGAIGLVRRSGILTAVDTQATNTYVNPGGETWLAGDLLWSTGTGGLSKTRPTSGRSVKAAFSMLGSNAADVLLAYPFENPVWSTAAAGENIVLRTGDSNGANKTSFRNYTNSEVAYVNSLGNAMFNGTIFTGNLSMSSQYITGLLTGSSGGSVPNKSYVDAAIAGVTGGDTTGFYFLNGTRILTGNMNAAGFNITNLSTPIGTLDAVTKAYADALPMINNSYVRIDNGSYVQVSNGSYVQITNGSYVQINNGSYVKVDNGSYVQITNGSYAKNPFYSYLTLMAGSAMVPTTNPATLGQDETSTGKNNYIMGNFTDGGSENLQWIIDMPADWDSTAATNGKLAFTFLWTAQEGTGNVNWSNVNWTMSGLVFPDDAALGTVLPEIGFATDTLLATGDMHISPDTTAALVTSAGTGGNVAIFKAARNTGSAADTFTGTAQLIGVRVKYIQTKVAA